MDDLPDTHFGDVLRRMRIVSGLSQEALSGRSGISVRGISDLERGRRRVPRLETIRMLADALQLDDAGRFEMIVASRPHLQHPANNQPSPPAMTAKRIRNLPHTLTSLIGRAREAAEISSIILGPDTRLLTLTGPGGIGKTRLALQAGDELKGEFADGAHFVPFVPLNSADLVVAAIAEVLAVRESEGMSLQQSLVAHLADKQMLLLVDNFEHVLEAAPVVHDLLLNCPALKIIATSRAPLHLRMEHIYDVSPLGLPDSDAAATIADMHTYDALALFVDRARMADAHFTPDQVDVPVIASICRRLDGLPLAIELAAARIRILSLSELQDLLVHSLPVLTGGARDLPPQQQTLQDTINWSYELLDEAARRLFRRLSVFAGGWTHAAAEAVDHYPDDRHRADTLTGLTALIDQSLVRKLNTASAVSRFGMLQTIREFGREKLMLHGEMDEVREAHALYFQQLVEALDFDHPAEDERARLELVDIEYDNLRVALRWFIERCNAPGALSLCAMITNYWTRRGNVSEARRWVEEALSIPASEPGAERAAALYTAGLLACHQNDLFNARRFCQESRALSMLIRDDSAIATALHGLGLVAQLSDEYERASEIYEECIALERPIAHSKLSITIGNMGQVQFHLGNVTRAIDLFNECIEIDRKAGGIVYQGTHMTDLALILVERGDVDEAHDLFVEALQIHQEVGFALMTIVTIEGIASVALRYGHAERAIRLLGAAEALRERLDYPKAEPDRWSYADNLRDARAIVGNSTFDRTWDEGKGMSMEATILYALNQHLARPIQNRQI